ncbi:VWA domain-containing protein [Bacterioplanoides sp.]|uniref:VWA domain-containing protein n=1 Tax=Bacterioplanoides sp. TaxID=2066072 RepID=UPI003B5AF92D
MVERRWLSGVMFLSLLLFSFPVIFSVQHTYAEDTPAKASDVRIVIDISGSMKQTDPNNLRTPALNLLVELLPDGAQSGVWTFGRYVNMLVPLGSVDQAWREKAKLSAGQINSVGLQTNLVDALDKAFWKMSADSGFDHSVILLTDGKIDMVAPGQGADINVSEKARLLNQVLPKYIEAGARIHTLALSGAADNATLQQISLETGGLYLQAENADQLLKAFLKAFDRAVPVEQVPMTNNQFEIDASVEEFTALVFRAGGARETTLVAPDGAVISEDNSRKNEDIRWHRDINFDLITVKNPQTGNWAADADIDPDNRVQILTDLKLQVDGLPSSIFAGYPVNLEMALTEKDQVLNEKAILELTDFTLKVTAPDGRTGSKLLSDPEALPEDGVFRESLTRLSQQGEYQIEITATGRTFQRRQLLTATLMEPLAVSVEPDYAEQVLNIFVTPQVDNVDTGLSRVIARVTSPDGSSVIHSMTFDPQNNFWHLPLSADKGLGDYEALLNIRGVTSNGSTFKSKPESIKATFPLIEDRGDSQSDGAAAETDVAMIGGPEKVAVEKADMDVPPAQPEVQQTEPPAEAMQPESKPEPEEQPEPEGQHEPEPVAEEKPPVEEKPEIQPDLAKKFEQQMNDEPQVDPEEEVEDGVSWWIYLILALGNLAVFGGAAFWWFKKRKPIMAPADPGAAPKPGDSGLPPDLEAEFDEADLDGDFDSFDDDGEEEIAAGGAPGAALGPGADDGLGLDDDFSIDPEEVDASDGGDDDWGEFDAPDDDKKE